MPASLLAAMKSCWRHADPRKGPFDWSKPATPRDIGDFFAAFRDGQLASIHWTHDAHCVAAIYAEFIRRYHGIEHDLTPLIRAHNEATGTANTASSGYHHTITLFYVGLIRAFVGALPERIDISEAVTVFLRTHLADRELPLRYYSRTRLFDALARATWVEPDLRPLDHVGEVEAAMRDASALPV